MSDIVENVKPFPPMRGDESTVVNGAEASRINTHCQNMQDEITRLRADLTRQIDINTSLASECESLREANKELVDALEKLTHPQYEHAYRERLEWAWRARAEAITALSKHKGN